MAVRRTSPINIVQTWDDAEKKFSSFRIDIATSGFAGGNAASRPFEIAVDGTVVFAVNASGNVTSGGNTGSIVNTTASSLTLIPALHAGRILTLNRTAGVAVQLPAATGTGAKYEIIVGTAMSGGSSTIKVLTTDIMQGLAWGSDDDVVPANGWATASDSDTVTLDGSTRGGKVGDRVTLTDIASGVWAVTCVLQQSGTEATPFSATVS